MMAGQPKKLRTATGKFLRNDFGAFATAVVVGIPLLATVETTITDTPDSQTGADYTAVSAALDEKMTTLQQQHQELTALRDILNNAQHLGNTGIDAGSIAAQKAELRTNFNTGLSELMTEIYTNDHLSERTALNHFRTAQKSFSEDMTAIGHTGYNSGILQSQRDAFSQLREARDAARAEGLSGAEKIGTMEQIMEKKSGQYVTLTIFFTALYFILILGAAAPGAVKNFARREKFKEWEKGRSPTPFHKPKPNH